MATTKTTIDESLTYRLKALSKIADRMSAELSRDKLGIPMPEASIVAALGRFGPMTLMDVARHANLDKSQASRTAESLLSRQLLARAASESDGRSVIFALTPEGRKLFRKLGPMVSKRDKALYHCMSEPEMEALRYLLDKVLASHGWQVE